MRGRLSGDGVACLLLASVAAPAIAQPDSVDTAGDVHPLRAEAVVKVKQGRRGRPARIPAGVAGVRCTP